MPPQHEKTAREINEVLLGLSVVDRAAALACSLVCGAEPESEFAILTLIEAALMLAKFLPPSERTRIAWHLSECIEELRARWN